MALLQTNCPNLKLLSRGKVRDIYDLGDDQLLIVTTDRVSAFDVVMKNGIAGKGKILNQISLFWFKEIATFFPNHVLATEVKNFPPVTHEYKDQLEGRSLLVRRLPMMPVEAIVRGYLAGSGWKEYTECQSVCGISFPAGLQENQKLEKPVFTPSTKAPGGMHDENISMDKFKELVGDRLANAIKTASLRIFEHAQQIAASKGLIIADTKLEFGTDKLENLVLADEVLTPDSSRYWIASDYRPGEPQNSYDKQIIRNYLLSINFDKKTPMELPVHIMDKTLAKYRELYHMLVGEAIVL